jgi:Zn-dependent protease with chaperone function
VKIGRDALVFLGAASGGALGYALFFYLASRGYYGLVLPGACLGLGAGIVRSTARVTPILCALLALALGAFTEWRFSPFLLDRSLGYFIRHFGDLSPTTVLMIALGIFAGFWVPFRRRKGA